MLRGNSYSCQAIIASVVLRGNCIFDLSYPLVGEVFFVYARKDGVFDIFRKCTNRLFDVFINVCVSPALFNFVCVGHIFYYRIIYGIDYIFLTLYYCIKKLYELIFVS